jgi:DNA-binding NarL/FixJ family response regulator
MRVTIHARHDDASALALAGLIAIVRPEATIDFADRVGCGVRPPDAANYLPVANGVSLLSSRESLVMVRLAAGCSVLECAEELHVSAATVQVYAARARSKLAT